MCVWFISDNVIVVLLEFDLLISVSILLCLMLKLMLWMIVVFLLFGWLLIMCSLCILMSGFDLCCISVFWWCWLCFCGGCDVVDC